jgi:hypothetical protein
MTTRPSFNSSISNQYSSVATTGPSLTDFKNLHKTVRNLEKFCNTLNETLQELNHKFDELSSEVDRQQKFECAVKNIIPFEVENFKKFLYGEFQKQLNTASIKYAWIHQIRL